MSSSVLWPHFPADHTGGKNPAADSSVLPHSWPQNQIARVGGWAKGSFQQIPTEVAQEADIPVPLPHSSLEPGPTATLSCRDPDHLYLESPQTDWAPRRSCFPGPAQYKQRVKDRDPQPKKDRWAKQPEVWCPSPACKIFIWSIFFLNQRIWSKNSGS